MTPKGPASVTLLPRRDHMAAGAPRSERTEREVETRVGGGEMETSGARKGGGEDGVLIQKMERLKRKRDRWGQREK